MNKKGNALAIIAVILALIILGIFLVNISMRECNSNRDCAENAYCGSDYECHEYPQQIVVQQSNFWPAFIVGICLIVAAYIFRKDHPAKGVS